MFYIVYAFTKTVLFEINPEESGGIIISEANVLLNNELIIKLNVAGSLCPAMSSFSKKQDIKKCLAVSARHSQIMFNTQT